MTRRITPLSYSIHAPDESPIFGEEATHVSAADEGAGMFLEIRQPRTIAAGCVRLDCGELADVVAAAEMLRLAHGGEA